MGQFSKNRICLERGTPSALSQAFGGSGVVVVVGMADGEASMELKGEEVKEKKKKKEF